MSSISSIRFRRPAIAVTLVVVAMFPGALAGSSSSADGALSPVGTYKLRSVNGKRLPVTLMQNDQFKAEIVGGSVTLKANQTYTTELVSRTTTGGHTQTTRDGHHGTYTIEGSALTIHSTKGDVLTGTINGKTITTLPSEKDPKKNFTFVFSK